MRSPVISFLLLLGLMMPLSACNFGGGEAEEAPENTEQEKAGEAPENTEQEKAGEAPENTEQEKDDDDDD